jgi:hypothetical protein
VLDINVALLDVQLMEALAVPAGALLPVGDGALVEAVGGDDGLAGAAVAQKSQDEGDQVEGLVQAVVGGILGDGEGLVAGGAAKAAFLLGVDADVAPAGLTPCSSSRSSGRIG